MNKVYSYDEFIKSNLKFIEQDLHDLIKRNPNFDISWGRIQNDEWDNDTNPYHIYSFDDFKKKWYNTSNKEKIRYALMRWIRYWCSQCDENIFCEKYSTPNPNKKDKMWDFMFNMKMGEFSGIKFDLKCTRIPKSLMSNQEYFIQHPDELIVWFYKNQSQQSRNGYQNRIFLVHIPKNDETETMSRCNFERKRIQIDKYYQSILGGEHKPYKLNINDHNVIADVIFV